MTHDVAVIGAGVAGCCSAVALQLRGRSVILLERGPAGPPEAGEPDWISRPAMQRLEHLEVKDLEAGGAAFRRAVFHSPDFSRSAASISSRPPGWRVDYAGLVAGLRRRAIQAGATLMNDCRVQRVEAGEDHVRVLPAEGPVLRARAAILAYGAEPLPGVTTGPGRRFAVRARLAVESGAGEPDDAMHWVPGLPEEVMYWFEHADARGRACWVTLHTAGPTAGAETRMRDLLAAAAGRGLLPKAAAGSAALRIRPLPVSGALEAETHVGKLTLTVGDAGGFISDLTGEGIHPAAWSGELAAEAMDRALAGRHVQDGLREFSELWRGAMAGYLRPPGADPHFLLPLVFSNRQIADRLASACWYGTDI